MKKNFIGIGVGIAILLIVYLGISAYFMNHFYFNTSINSVNVSGDTVNNAITKVEDKLNNFKIELILENGDKEYITSKDIGLNVNLSEAIEQLKDRQAPFAWIFRIFNKNYTTLDIATEYDTGVLNNYLNSINIFSKGVSPKEPTFKYVNGQYEILKQVEGNKVDKEKLDKDILNAVENNKAVINLKEDNCYQKPKYTETSPEVLRAKEVLDKYVNTKITFTFGDNNTVLTGDTISGWLSVNKDMNVVINEAAVAKYVKTLATKYNTVGKARPFKTSLGNTVIVSGGDYGWKLNEAAETDKIIESIKQGENINMNLIFSQKEANYGEDGVGNTYVEVNLGLQKVWLYKDGKLVIESDTVTGNVSEKHGTPPGYYYVKYKEKNARLKGENYDVPVKYWMPFNGGIGLHDADWRNKFGGDIYLKSGSHGCVNLPPNVAETIFNNISAGTPVVCYN
ncbi:peptidoglycan binding domain-containing protein [uncultured Clostridium sp.]|uniref:L,D-transpeptidase family protein n=1 Tax=uncultured Clostridium sp. TaxID=59620 RepID=UPI0026145A12|nr:peptidoglycan binding domain-containing protein [uncultured Clostridium sp.]